MNLERAVGVELQRGEVELDPARLRVVRIDVHDRQRLTFVAGGFAVADDLVVVGLVELQRQCSAAARDSRGGCD